MENNQEILQLKLISNWLHCLDLYPLDPHTNVRAHTMVEILEGEAQKIPETNEAMSKKRRKEAIEVWAGFSVSPWSEEMAALTE